MRCGLGFCIVLRRELRARPLGSVSARAVCPASWWCFGVGCGLRRFVKVSARAAGSACSQGFGASGRLGFFVVFHHRELRARLLGGVSSPSCGLGVFVLFRPSDRKTIIFLPGEVSGLEGDGRDGVKSALDQSQPLAKVLELGPFVAWPLWFAMSVSFSFRRSLAQCSGAPFRHQ